MAYYLNFGQFHLDKALFWGKKWHSNQNGVLIESGILLPRISIESPEQGPIDFLIDLDKEFDSTYKV